MKLSKQFSKCRKLTKLTGDRVKKTRLYLLENGQWAIGNSSSFLEALTTAVRATAGAVTARNAAVDITHAMEDYACSDYKCLVLDSVAAACDVTGAVVSFLPGKTTKTIFAATITASSFCRTLRDKCKETNVFGCK